MDIEFRITRTIKVRAFSQENAELMANAWWDGASLAESTEGADDIIEFYINNVLRVEGSEKCKF